MPDQRTHSALRKVGQRFPDRPGSAPPSDEHLLQRYLCHREEAAFAALMERHGAMVLGVCRSVLRHAQDAEDAAQATFLVLARKAASVRHPGSLASWLHGVAYRLSLKAKAARSRAPQGRMNDRPSPSPMDELTWRELRGALHQELGRLPEHYRLPLILCYLEGHTQEEAAHRLGWTAGVLKGRLDRGRALLRQRLTRRGLALAAPLLAVSLSRGTATGTLPATLIEATARSAAPFQAGEGALAGVSSQAVALAEEGVKSMALTKLRLAVALVLMVLAAGVGLATYPAQEAKEPPGPSGPPTGRPDLPPTRPVRADRHGDPLPARAVARIGTVRWWHGRDQLNCSLVFTPDGKSLAFCEQDTVRILDAATGKEQRRFQNPDGEVTSFALSPDGKTLVTAARSPVLRIWEFSTGKERRRLTMDKPGTYAVAFSPDGKTFAAATGQIDIQLWDVATWRETRRLRGHTGSITSLGFLPDGKSLISAGGTCRSTRWWDTRTGREVRRLEHRLAHRRHHVLSPDGKRLAAVVRPNLLLLWDAVTGKEVSRTVLGKEGGVWCLAFSPDSRTLACGNAVGDRGNQTLFFAAATGKELYRWDEDAYTTRLAYSPDGKVLAQAVAGRIRLRDPATGKLTQSVPGVPDRVLAVRFNGDGNGLTASCYDGHTGSWDPLTGKPLALLRAPPKEFAGKSGMLLATALTTDGKQAAAVDGEGALTVWETATGKVRCRISDPPVGRDQPDFSPDGRSLVVKHKDGIIRLWDARTGKLRCSLPPPKSSQFPHAHAFSPDGRVLAAAGRQDENLVRLWDAATGKAQGELAWYDNTRPTCLLFSPDGRWLVAAHGQELLEEDLVGPNSVRLWDLASKREVLRLPLKSGDVRALALSPDGKTLAAADHDTIVLWELASGQERGRFSGHRDWVWSLAFSPDGRLLASGSMDFTALVWDVTGVCPDGKWSPRATGPKELERLWADLAGDGERSFRAVWALALTGETSVPFLAKRLRPVARVEERRLNRLIADLDSDQFAVRDRAAKELKRLGELAGPAIRKALANRPTPEARRRLGALARKLGGPVTASEELRSLRAVEALEKVGTPEARKVLVKLADGAPGAPLTRETKASLERLDKRPSPAP